MRVLVLIVAYENHAEVAAFAEGVLTFDVLGDAAAFSASGAVTRIQDVRLLPRGGEALRSAHREREVAVPAVRSGPSGLPEGRRAA